MSIQINKHYETILKKIAEKKKKQPLDILSQLLLDEYKKIFKKDYLN